jgi:CDP-6-deoxy-D-xylo-4-hexulose-3-dehydrase
VDVDPGTLAIDLERAAEALRVSPIPIRGIFPIHVLGRGISSTKLQSFANEHNLELINDVCESLGSWENGTHAGTCGSGGSFSFYFSHHITTMEGGGVATNSLDFADDLRSIRSHGWSRDRSDSSDWKSDHSDLNAKFLFVSTGFNIRPMEVQAAIGLSQIKDISSFILRRRKLASMVNDVIKGTELELIGSDCLTGLEYDTKHSWMMLPIRVSGQCKSFTKDDLITFLESLGVETRPVLTGNFLAQPAMKRINSDGYDPSVFNIANDVTRRTLLIGAHHDFSDQQMDHIANCLKYFLETHQS